MYATDGQIKFIADLIENRDLSNYPAHKVDAVNRLVSGQYLLPRSSASAAIDELRELPVKEAFVTKTGQLPTQTDVPEGRYAIEADGTLKFYVVDRPTEGKWAGCTFVKVQASDDLYPVRGRAAREAVLRAIAEAGPESASKRYGQEIGACGVCGRTLTDETSRANGIGPICSQKMGW